MKERLLSVLVILALASGLVSAACGTTEKEPIKIGVLAALTGPFNTQESEAVKGMELAFEEVDYTVADREIELLVEDVGADPGLCLSKLRKLREQDNVDLIIGPAPSYLVEPIRNYIHENELPTISHMGPIPSMIEDLYTEYFFRSSYNYKQENALAAYVAYEKGYRKAVAVFMDIDDGEGNWEPFKDVFEALGGEVVLEIPTPMDCPDYGPYVTQIELDRADFVWSFHVGGDAIRFVTALDDYGITLPVFCSAATVSEGWLVAIGDAALGIESVTNYSPVLDTPENERFVQALWDAYQQQATVPTEYAYVAARMAIMALEEVEGNAEDVDGLIETLENLEFEAPRGPVKFESHSPVQNLYLRVVEKIDGKLQNTVVQTFPDIGPVWLPEELQ